MNQTALNDVTYNFEPLELFIPDPNYKADHAELQKSREKSRELIAFLHDYNTWKENKNTEQTL